VGGKSAGECGLSDTQLTSHGDSRAAYAARVESLGKKSADLFGFSG
jgi:hypothetical protein